MCDPPTPPLRRDWAATTADRRLPFDAERRSTASRRPTAATATTTPTRSAPATTSACATPPTRTSTTRAGAATTSSSATTTSRTRRTRASDPFDDVYDDDGHGSHTGSTTAGNQVEATAYAAKGTEHEFSVTSTIKGVAPHANVIGYDVCDGGCQGYSIVTSSSRRSSTASTSSTTRSARAPPPSPWTDLDAIGFLNARAAGIHVATSAGNDGPGAATLGSPGRRPVDDDGRRHHARPQVRRLGHRHHRDRRATRPDIAGAGLSGATDGCVPDRLRRLRALQQPPVQPARRRDAGPAPSRPARTCPA